MSYQRLILHYGHDPEDFLGVLSQSAVKRCWFELHRQGGCGPGELRLNQEFMSRDAIEPGHWIAFEYSTGVRWYFGRVEQVDCNSPAGMRIQLEGASVELTEVFPGALTAVSGGAKPHRYGRTDLFGNDPDHDVESQDYVVNSAELIRKLVEQYVAGKTNILHVPGLIETGTLVDDVTTMKFHGEETVRSIIKDLALRAGNVSWGVDAERRFFFLQPRNELAATYDEHRDLTRLASSRSREQLFNRVMLTGDYVYDRKDYSSQVARRSFRWRGNYRQPASIEEYGERRLRMWIPWIRTKEDSRAFVTEFFRVYATPVTQYALQTKPQSALPVPWEGRVRLRDRNGVELVTMQAERVRVLFDHAPVFQIELGPEDPRNLWPEPPHDERWELPEDASNYGGSDLTLSSDGVSLTDQSHTNGTDGSDATTSNAASSEHSAVSEDSATSVESVLSSQASSDGWSDGSSATSGLWSSEGTSEESRSSVAVSGGSSGETAWSETSAASSVESSGWSSDGGSASSIDWSESDSWSSGGSESLGESMSGSGSGSDFLSNDPSDESSLNESWSSRSGSEGWTDSSGMNGESVSGETSEQRSSWTEMGSDTGWDSSDGGGSHSGGEESQGVSTIVDSTGASASSDDLGGSHPSSSEGGAGSSAGGATETWEEQTSWNDTSESLGGHSSGGAEDVSSDEVSSNESQGTDSTLWW